VPASRLSDKVLQETLAAIDAADGNISLAARTTGIGRSTLEGRYRTALARFDLERASGDADTSPHVELPVFPDESLEATEILDHLSRSWNKRQTHEEAKRWFEIKIKSDIFGLAVVGDPHLGTHCHVDLLRSDVETMAEMNEADPGSIGACQIGDTVNNWSQRLIHLYADEDISRSTERRLARWFLLDKESGGAGVPWCVWLHGNHDTMHSEFATYLKTINVAQIPMMDWRAKFKLVLPSAEIKVDAAHNHKGTSIYNPLHGQKRASLWDEDADLYVAGHHHTWAISQEEHAGGRVVTMGRARGYKHHDDFALHHGFNEERFGASLLFVCDGTAPANSRIKPFSDLNEGVEFLKWKRSRK
jgi:hypothetical protein